MYVDGFLWFRLRPSMKPEILVEDTLGLKFLKVVPHASFLIKLKVFPSYIATVCWIKSVDTG